MHDTHENTPDDLDGLEDILEDLIGPGDAGELPRHAGIEDLIIHYKILQNKKKEIDALEHELREMHDRMRRLENSDTILKEKHLVLQRLRQLLGWNAP